MGTLQSPRRVRSISAGCALLSLLVGPVATAEDAGPKDSEPVEVGIEAEVETATSALEAYPDAGGSHDAALVILRLREVALDAAVSDGAILDGGEGAATVQREVFIATYHGLDSPIEFQVSAKGKLPRARAKEATEALSAALDRELHEEPDPITSVDVLEDRAIVRVRGLVVATFYPEDAVAAGMTLAEFAQVLEARLHAYVPTQLRRNTLQLLVLHIFVSVFLIVLAVLTLRFLRRAFDRWDDMVEARSTFPGISIFRVPIVSTEAVKGLLAFGVTAGRFVAYVLTVFAAAAGILGQFDTTRPMLGRIAAGTTEPLVRGAEGMLSSIPGLILATALVLGLYTGLRVLNTLLDGIASKRVPSKRLPPQRVPAFRAVAKTGALLIIAPLIVASAFGRFGTPLETLTLVTGGAVLLAVVPVLASVAVGVVTLWREPVHAGDWVEIGGTRGEVTQVNLHEIRVVPEGGGAVIIPMLYLLVHPIRRLREAPEWSIELSLLRHRPAGELLADLRAKVATAAPDARVEPTAIESRMLRVRIYAPLLKPGLREIVLLALSEAIDREEIELAPEDRHR